MGNKKIWCPRIYTIQSQDRPDDVPETQPVAGQLSTLFMRPDNGPLTTTEVDLPAEDSPLCIGRAVVYRDGRFARFD